MRAEFFDRNEKFIQFKDFGNGDIFEKVYLDHKDDKLKQEWLEKQNEKKFNDPMSSTCLSRWILWNKTSLTNSVYDYIKKFDLELV
jgi:hypothetical protein